jgi:4-amino-4-deoxy-L-arabinose transferase-like glycosyltransferase
MVIIVLSLQFVPSGFAENESHDYARFYEPVARGILSGQGLRLDDGCLAVRYPPGYPAYLAGLFGLARALNVPEDSVVAVAILLITALTATLVFRMARTLWSDGWSVIAALAWLVYPFNLWLTKQTNSETPYLLLLYAALALYWELEVSESESRPRYAAVGLLLGLAMLVRPVAIAMGGILAVYTWVRRSGRSSRRVRAVLVAMLLLGSAIVVAP